VARRSKEIAVLVAALRSSGRTLAVAESLTCGNLAARLGAGEEASEWFRGGVIAYMDDVKFTVLGVTPGPVVTAVCAEQMAVGVRDLLGADISIAVTGVGGPGPAEGQPAGTVYIAVATSTRVSVVEEHFRGGPERVLRSTMSRAISLATSQLRTRRSP
jgi:nicotinamide-nucleotide amidase